jgi:pimeloyl-ACP methyl ester carboxylesterase
MAEPTVPAEDGLISASQDIWFEPASTGITSDQYMVYMIPGNPCIMTYYRLFLSTLSKLLDEALAPRELTAHVGGYTLPGFRLKRGILDDMKLPTSLACQVRNVEAQIRVAIREKVECDARSGRPKVILVAHSIGTYITHEILRRQAVLEEGFLDLDVIGAILICGPVTGLADTNNDATASVCCTTWYSSSKLMSK